MPGPTRRSPCRPLPTSTAPSPTTASPGHSPRPGPSSAGREPSPSATSTPSTPPRASPAPGTYTLRLTANDGALSAFDDVVVTVNSSGGSAVTFEVRVSVGTDDAEEKSGTLDNFSGDLDLGARQRRRSIGGPPLQRDHHPSGLGHREGLGPVHGRQDRLVGLLPRLPGAGRRQPTHLQELEQHHVANEDRGFRQLGTPGWTVVGQAGPAQQTTNLARSSRRSWPGPAGSRATRWS